MQLVQVLVLQRELDNERRNNQEIRAENIELEGIIEIQRQLIDERLKIDMPLSSAAGNTNNNNNNNSSSSSNSSISNSLAPLIPPLVAPVPALPSLAAPQDINQQPQSNQSHTLSQTQNQSQSQLEKEVTREDRDLWPSLATIVDELVSQLLALANK